MADFNAGSIEGTLDVDTDPFVRGLRAAKLQAEEFESRSYKATVETRYESVGDKPDPTDGNTSTTSTSKIKADDSQFERTVAEDAVKLKALGAMKAEPKVNVETSKARSSISAIERAITDLNGAFNKGNPKNGEPGGGHGLLMLVGLAASLAPALAPAVPAVALFGAAAIAAFGGAAVSLGLYAKIATGAVKTLTDAIAAGKQLPGTAGLAETALKGLTKAWGDLKEAAGPGVFELLTNVFNTMQDVIPKLLPLINAMSKGLIGAFQPLTHLLEGRTFEKFLGLLSANALKDLPILGSAITNIFRGLMRVFMALNPVIQQSLRWFQGITVEFAHWAKFKAPDFIHQTFGEIKRDGPGLLHMLDSLFKALFSLGRGLGPLVAPATRFLTALFDGIGKIDLAPLATGVGKVLDALTPFLGMIADLVNVLLPPLGALLGDLADSFITPLATSLESALTPAFQGLADILKFAEPYIAAVLKSLANLVNPTGVGFFSALLKAIKPVIEKLIPPMTDLVVAIEGLVDSFLNSLVPMLGPAGSALGTFVDNAAPFIEWVADKISAHPEYAVAIVGLAAAIKALKLAARGAEALSGFADTLGLLGLTGPVGLAILAIAALAGGLYLAYKHSKTFRDVVGEIRDWIMDKAFPALVTFRDYFVEKIIPALEHTAHVMRHNLMPIWDQLKDTAKGLQPHVQRLYEEFKKWWPEIKETNNKLGPLVLKMGELWSLLAGFTIPKEIKFLGVAFGAAFDEITFSLGLLRQNIAVFSGLFDDFTTGAATIIVWGLNLVAWLQTLPDKIKMVFSAAKTWLYDKGSDILHGLHLGAVEGWIAVKAWFNERESRIKDFFSNSVNWLESAGRRVIAGLHAGVTSRYEDLRGWFSGIDTRIEGFFTNAVNWLDGPGRRVLGGLFTGITDRWTNDVRPWFAALSGSIFAAVGDLSQTLYRSGLAIMQGLLDGILKLWESVKSTVRGINDWLRLNKGPIEKDRVMWFKPGQAIMGGLIRGLKSMMPDLMDTVGGINDLIGLNAPSLSIAGPQMRQASAISDLNDRLMVMTEGIMSAVNSLGEGHEDTRTALVDALGTLGDRVVESDQTSTRTVLTSIRKR